MDSGFSCEEVPVLNSLEELVAFLHDVFSSDSVNVDYVKAAMATYKSNCNEWARYAKFDRYK